MGKNKKLSPFSILSIALSLELAIAIGLPIRTLAQTGPGQNQPLTLSAGVTFDPPGDSKPDDSAGGASRDGGRCADDPKTAGPALTSLIPVTNRGLTVATHPTFFVYVPATSATEGFLSIEDENNPQQQYQTNIPLTGQAGVIGVPLPDNAPVLEVGKTYKWSFVIKCGGVLRPDSPLVEGKVQRVEVSDLPRVEGQIQRVEAADLSNQSPLERASVYGKKGIWYDTLANLAIARRDRPDDASLKDAWTQLLQSKSVGLDAIATQPLSK